MTTPIKMPFYTPVEMSFSEYVGPFELVKGVLPLHGNRVGRWIAGEQLGEVRGYALHRVLYSPHPEDHARALAQSGEAVVARIAGANVGGVREHYVWVHDQHAKVEGLHLASSLAARWFVLNRRLGTDWRLTAESRAKHGSDRLTSVGLHFRIRAYSMMVESGILICPEGVRMPAFATLTKGLRVY